MLCALCWLLSPMVVSPATLHSAALRYFAENSFGYAFLPPVNGLHVSYIVITLVNVKIVAKKLEIYYFTVYCYTRAQQIIYF
jgi:hypothetical protein